MRKNTQITTLPKNEANERMKKEYFFPSKNYKISLLPKRTTIKFTTDESYLRRKRVRKRALQVSEKTKSNQAAFFLKKIRKNIILLFSEGEESDF